MAEPAQDPSPAGREEAHLREIAVRCERLSSSRWIDLAPAILAGAFCGMSAFMLFMPMVYRSLAQMPAAPGENWLIDSARALQWTARVWTILGLIALIFVGPRIARWIADWRLKSTTLPELRRWRKVRRRKSPRWLWPALSIPILAVYLLAPWQVSALITAKVLADAAGVTIAFAWFGRRGNTLVCGRCDYAMSSWFGAPDKCSECGNDWKAPWGARLGVRTVRWWWVGIGAGMLTLSLGLIFIFLRWIINR